ncbi:MAG: NYN domain-containing protein [DPANN group archaeon]|nr:NYN domain-containing protein [DPANN group archaeon]
MIFIDGSNLYHGLKKHTSKKYFNYEKFVNLLCGKERELVRAYYYNAPLPQQADPTSYQKQRQFFDNLQRIPYFELRLGRLEPREKLHICTNCESASKIRTYKDKGVDLKMAIDMLSHAASKNFDTAIIVTGDGDFVEAVSAIKKFGLHVEHVYFKDRSQALQQSCDKSIILTEEFLKDCFV